MPEVAAGAGPRLEIARTPQLLADLAAAWLLKLAQASTDRFSLCLSGGSTPKALYRRLSQPPYRDTFPWNRTHLWWGDERFVPPDDALSNFRMVKEALLDHAPIPPENIHATPTIGLTPEDGAAAYEADLKAFYGADTLDPAKPLFDVNLLGLGPDGHTASLFPGTAVLKEREAWAAAVIGAKDEPRITLTYPVLESARHAAFLAVGADKAPILFRLREGDADLPAAHIKPVGELLIFTDTAAVEGAP